jgi:thiol:disulfide interchange protein DsbD
MKSFSLLIIALIFCLGSCTAQTISSNQSAVGVELNKFLAKSTKPAVIKFYADWCSSCKEFQPSFKKVSKSMSSQVDFFELDIDQKTNKALIKELKVSRIPETIFVNKARTSLTRKLGVMSETDFVKKIEQLLAH